MERIQIGFLFSLAALANTLSRPLSGLLSSKIGEAKTIYVGLTLMALALIALASPLPTAMIMGVMLYGSSMGLFIPSSVILVSRVVPTELRTVSMAYLRRPC